MNSRIKIIIIVKSTLILAVVTFLLVIQQVKPPARSWLACKQKHSAPLTRDVAPWMTRHSSEERFLAAASGQPRDTCTYRQGNNQWVVRVWSWCVHATDGRSSTGGLQGPSHDARFQMDMYCARTFVSRPTRLFHPVFPFSSCDRPAGIARAVGLRAILRPRC